MANAYQTAYQYRDPEKLDISILGKAMQYEQQEYDQGVAQIQQLVNQYAGVDLMKDVDKEYFGQRLSTIVDFINTSGTKSWGNKGVQSQIQNYVSGALDDKVLNAISSTKKYQSQMAKIEEIKKSKPELWSLQNQEFATQDLQRYLSSKEVGDTYQARDYINYKDVQKHILDNAKLLKEYGVEYKFEPMSGNAYFTRIGKSERIEPETAREFLNMIMTPDMQTQLAIDGWYTYRNTEDDVLQEKYNSKLDANLEYADKRKTELNLELTKATGTKKQELLAQINKIDAFKSDIADKKQKKLDRGTLVNHLYTNDFYDKNTSFLSYDRVIDSFVDDSGFKLAQFDHTVRTDTWNMNQKANEFNYKTQQDARDNAFRDRQLNLEEKKAGLVYDPSTGTYVADPNSLLNASGMITTDIAADSEDKETPDGFLKATETHAYNAGLINTEVVADVQRVMKDPANAKLISDLNIDDPKQLAWFMVNSPSKAKTLYNLMSSKSKDMIDSTISTVSALRKADESLKGIRTDAAAMVRAIETSPKENSKKLIDFANNGLVIDEKGNVVQGSSMTPRNDNFAYATKMIGVYNSILASGNLSESKEAQIRRLIHGEIKNIKVGDKPISNEKANDIYEKMVYKTQAKGFWQTAGDAILSTPIGVAIGQIAKTAESAANLFGGTDEYTFAKDFGQYVKTAMHGNYNTRGILDRVRSQYEANKTQNEDIWSLGKGDINTKASGFSADEFRTRIDEKTTKVTESLTDFSYTVNKAVNISLGSKAGQAMLPSLQSVLPIGTNIEKDSNVQMVIDQKTGLAKIIASVKDGKDYSVETFENIKVSELPPQVLNNIRDQTVNTVYSAKNPYAVKYRDTFELNENMAEYREKIDYLPELERYNAMQNPPVTKEDMINRFKSTYGEEVVNKHAESISKIINTPVEVTTEAVGGKWSIVARQNGSPIYWSPPADEVYNRDLIGKQSELLVTDLIQKEIAKVLAKN